MSAPTGTAVAVHKPALTTGGEVQAIIPKSIEEMFRLAGAIKASGLAPSSFDTADKIMVAIMAGAEVGLAPFQSLQSFAVINGRPSLWGDGLLAIVLSHGFKVDEWFDAEIAPTRAFCKVTRPDTGQITERTYSIDDASAAKLIGKTGPWQTNQKRMLQMRARAFALRDGAADVLRGFQIREEVEDYQHVKDVTPQPTGMRARLEARTPTGGFNAEYVSEALDEAQGSPQAAGDDRWTEDAAEFAEPVEPAGEPQGVDPDGEAAPAFDPLDWAAEQNGLIEAARSLADLDALRDNPDAPARFTVLQESSPAVAKALDAAMRGKRKALADRERG